MTLHLEPRAGATRLSIAKLGLDFVLFASVIVGLPFLVLARWVLPRGSR